MIGCGQRRISITLSAIRRCESSDSVTPGGSCRPACRFIGAERALAVGLVSEVVEEDGLEAAAAPYLDAMMTASPVGLRLSKECLNMSVDAGSLETVIAMEDRNQVLCSRSEDFSEGIRAFMEKRKPVYVRR